MKNTFLTLILFFITSITSVAQSSDWTLYKTIDGVKIYTKESDCIFKDGSKMNQKVILFKYENTTDKKISVEWDLRVWYNDKEAVNNVTAEENHLKLNINANSSVNGDESLKNRSLYLYKKFLDFEKSQEMTKFELENLKVSKIN